MKSLNQPLNLLPLHTRSMLCRQLNVSVSGYLAHQHHPASARRKEDLRLTITIKVAHAHGRAIFGPIKIQAELAAAGIYMSVNRMKRLRKAAGIRCIHKLKFRVTTNSKHKLPIAPNLLNRQFSPSAPNQVCATDITYIPTDEGCLYLAAVKDLYTYEIVG